MAWSRPSLFEVARVCGAWLLIAATVAVAGFLLVQMVTLSLAVFAAVLLTCLLWPVVGGLERRLRMPRGLAAVLSVLLSVGVLAGALSWIIPAAIAEVSASWDTLTTNLREAWSGVENRLPGAKRLGGGVERLPELLGKHSQTLLTGVTSSLLTLTEIVGGLLLALVLSVFFLRDGRKLSLSVLERMSAPKRRVFEPALLSTWKTLRGWIRGASLIALGDAIGIGVGLAVLGVPLVLPLALLTFFAAFIPVLGATVAGAVAVLVAWATGGTTDALITLAIVVGVQQLEGNVLEPLVMGRAVPLHPAVVLMVVTAGALLGGIAGAFASVPIAAALAAFFKEVARRSEPPSAPERDRTELLTQGAPSPTRAGGVAPEPTQPAPH